MARRYQPGKPEGELTFSALASEICQQVTAEQLRGHIFMTRIRTVGSHSRVLDLRDVVFAACTRWLLGAP